MHGKHALQAGNIPTTCQTSVCFTVLWNLAMLQIVCYSTLDVDFFFQPCYFQRHLIVNRIWPTSILLPYVLISKCGLSYLLNCITPWPHLHAWHIIILEWVVFKSVISVRLKSSTNQSIVKISYEVTPMIRSLCVMMGVFGYRTLFFNPWEHRKFACV